jgi:NodT family efflux transporter outer membrane factor (OMF) lipoprotein
MSTPERLIVPAVLATLMSACATVGPDFQKPPAVAPASWTIHHGGAQVLAASPDAATPQPVDRWSVFNDPELTRLQALARLANADARSAGLRLLQARAAQATVSAQRGVQVAAKGGVSRQRQSEVGSASRLVNAMGSPNTPQLLELLSSPFTLYQAGFDASWEPDLWGRVWRAGESAQAGADEQAAAFRQVQLAVAAEVARAYFGLRAAQRQRQLVQDELAAAQEALGLLQAQFGNGLADESALIRQRSQLAGLQAQWPGLLAQEAQALNQITLLCGAQPGDLNDALVATPMTSVAATLPDLRLGLPSELAQRRPDVAAAEARLHAATANIGLAVADLYPRITLGASFGFESVGSTKFGEWGSRLWSIGPSLSLPLWDQGRRRSTITLRELQQQEAAVAYQQVVLKAWHEVDDAIAAYVAETQRSAEIVNRARDAEEEAALARARYKDGLSSFLPVLSSSIAVIDVQRDLVESNARMRTALVALYKALGDDVALTSEVR